METSTSILASFTFVVSCVLCIHQVHLSLQGVCRWDGEFWQGFLQSEFSGYSSELLGNFCILYWFCGGVILDNHRHTLETESFWNEVNFCLVFKWLPKYSSVLGELPLFGNLFGHYGQAKAHGLLWEGSLIFQCWACSGSWLYLTQLVWTGASMCGREKLNSCGLNLIRIKSAHWFINST